MNKHIVKLSFKKVSLRRDKKAMAWLRKCEKVVNDELADKWDDINKQAYEYAFVKYYREVNDRIPQHLKDGVVAILKEKT